MNDRYVLLSHTHTYMPISQNFSSEWLYTSCNYQSFLYTVRSFCLSADIVYRLYTTGTSGVYPYIHTYIRYPIQISSPYPICLSIRYPISSSIACYCFLISVSVCIYLAHIHFYWLLLLYVTVYVYPYTTTYRRSSHYPHSCTHFTYLSDSSVHNSQSTIMHLNSQSTIMHSM